MERGGPGIASPRGWRRVAAGGAVGGALWRRPGVGFLATFAMDDRIKVAIPAGAGRRRGAGQPEPLMGRTKVGR